METVRDGPGLGNPARFEIPRCVSASFQQRIGWQGLRIFNKEIIITIVMIVWSQPAYSTIDFSDLG